MLKNETRILQMELRASQGDEGSLMVSGRAASYDCLSEDMGGWRERIKPGTFTRSLQGKKDVLFNVNHDPQYMLARRSSKTLSVSETASGIEFSARLDPQVSYARDAFQNVRNGNLKECSFAFTVDPDGDEWGYEDDPDSGERIGVRTLKSATLQDVSIVHTPAYSRGATNVQATSTGDYNPSTMPAPRSLPASMPVEMRAKISAERAEHRVRKQWTDDCLAEIQEVTARAEQLARGSRSEQSQSAALLAKAANLRNAGVSSKEILARSSKNQTLSKYTPEFRAYLTGRISSKEYRDFLAGTSSITYSQGSQGGFFVPVEFWNEAIEAIAQVDPLMDETKVTVIKNKALTANPVKISGWDLTALKATRVNEASQQSLAVVPSVSGKVLGGFTYRIPLAASLEFQQDAFDAGEDFDQVMKNIAHAYGIAFARGIGQDLVNGTGTLQPQGLLVGAANSGYVTITPSVAGVTPLKYSDFSAIYGSIDRIYRASKKCAWVVNDITYTQIRNAVDNSGRPLLDMSQDQELLFGKPVLISPSMPSGPGSQGILFGDLSHYFVRLSAPTIQRQIQETAGNAGSIVQGEANYIGRMRADAAVFDPSTPQGSPAVTHPPIVFAVLHS